jgi:hypothetical protein
MVRILFFHNYESAYRSIALRYRAFDAAFIRKFSKTGRRNKDVQAEQAPNHIFCGPCHGILRDPIRSLFGGRVELLKKLIGRGGFSIMATTPLTSLGRSEIPIFQHRRIPQRTQVRSKSLLYRFWFSPNSKGRC